MHVGVRGPISFARLRHVLVLHGRRAGVTLLCAIAATALRGDPAFGEHAYWLAVQSWWIGDFLGALIVTPLVLTVGFHGFALTTHSRGGRAATLSAFGVLLVLLFGGVPAQAWRAHCRRWTFLTSSIRCWSGSRCSAARGAPRSPRASPSP